MFDIVYYIVPQMHMDICEGVDRDNWSEIIVTDSENVYEYKHFWDRFRQILFADDFAKVAYMLWSVKAERERLLFKKKDGKYNDGTEIGTENELFEKLESTNDRKSQYTLDYVENGKINKRVCSNYYYDPRIYVKKECLQNTEKLLEKIAEKGNYYKYELGED